MSEKLSNPPSPVLVGSSMLALIVLVLIGIGYGFQALHTNSRANRFEAFFGFQPEKEHRRQAEVDAHFKHKKKNCLDLLGQYVDAAKKESLKEFKLKYEAKQACENEDHSKLLAEEFGYR